MPRWDSWPSPPCSRHCGENRELLPFCIRGNTGSSFGGVGLDEVPQPRCDRVGRPTAWDLARDTASLQTGDPRHVRDSVARRPRMYVDTGQDPPRHSGSSVHRDRTSRRPAGTAGPRRSGHSSACRVARGPGPSAQGAGSEGTARRSRHRSPDMDLRRGQGTHACSADRGLAGNRVQTLREAAIQLAPIGCRPPCSSAGRPALLQRLARLQRVNFHTSDGLARAFVVDTGTAVRSPA